MVKIFVRSEKNTLDALVESVTRFRLAVADARQRPAEIEKQIDGLLGELSDLHAERLEMVGAGVEALEDIARRRWGVQNRIAEWIKLMNDPTALSTARRDLTEAENRLAGYVAREWVSR